MKATLIVSSRGQVTLPAALRKRTGIKEGSALIVEDRGNELVLKPAAVLELEMYSDRQIEEWNKADRLTTQEKSVVLGKLKRKR
jgi:antitoxin PrlF